MQPQAAFRKGQDRSPCIEEQEKVSAAVDHRGLRRPASCEPAEGFQGIGSDREDALLPKGDEEEPSGEG